MYLVHNIETCVCLIWFRLLTLIAAADVVSHDFFLEQQHIREIGRPCKKISRFVSQKNIGILSLRIRVVSFCEVLMNIEVLKGFKKRNICLQCCFTWKIRDFLEGILFTRMWRRKILLFFLSVKLEALEWNGGCLWEICKKCVY